MDLVNVATGAVEPIDDAKAQAAIVSGKYTFAAGSTVPIRTEQGRTLALPAEQAIRHVTGGTGAIVGAHELAAQAHETAGSYLAAGAEGLARGASVGLSDPAAIAAARLAGGDEAAEKVRSHLAEQRDAHPLLSTAAEIGGAVAGSALTGGASDEAEAASLASRGLEAATALPRGLARAGGAVERGVAALLPEADGLAARAVSKAVSGGAGAAVENAAWGVGQAIDEDSLNAGDTQLTAEQLLAAAGHGALLGGVLGGATHGLMSAAGEGLSRAVERVGEGEGMTGFLRAQADKLAWKATEPGVRAADEAERVGGAAAVGRTLHDEGVFSGSLADALAKPEELAARVEAAKNRIGEKLGAVIEKSEARVSASELVAPLDKMIAEHAATAGHEGIAKGLSDYRDSFLRHLGLETPETVHARAAEGIGETVSVRDVYRQRKGLDDIIYREAKSLDPGMRVAELRAFRGTVAAKEIEALESAGAVHGEVRELRDKYARLSIAQKSLEASAGRARPAIGLGSLVTGAIVGHGPIGIAAALGKQLAYDRGNQIAAFAANKLHHVLTAGRVVESVTDRINAGLRGYVSRTVEAVGRTSARKAVVPALRSGSLATTFARTAERVQASAQPAVARERIAQGLGSLAAHAPKVAGAMASIAASDAQYLASILPTPPPAPSSLQPQLKNHATPSDSEMSRFVRFASLLDKPLLAVDKLRAGTLLQDEADMLRDRRPALYRQMQRSAMEAVAHRATELPYEKRRALGVLLGVPTDPSLAPAFVATMQQSYLGPAQMPPKLHSQAALHMAHPTELDRMENDDV